MVVGYVRWVTGHAGSVVALVLLLTLGLLTRATRLKVEVNPDAQLPQRHPYIQALARLHEIFGEKNLVFVGLFPKSGDVYSPEFLAKLARITERIGALPGLVSRTFLSLSLSKAVDIRGAGEGMIVRPFLDPLPKDRAEALALRERLLANPQYLGTIIAADGRAAGIIADFDFQAPLDGYPEIQAAITHVLEEEEDGSFRAHLSGPAIYVAWLARYSARMFLLFPARIRSHRARPLRGIPNPAGDVPAASDSAPGDALEPRHAWHARCGSRSLQRHHTDPDSRGGRRPRGADAEAFLRRACRVGGSTARGGDARSPRSPP